MPRDANGNMSLPIGNPVVTGTAISSAVQNATMADLAAEIQDSLSRSGKGGMTVAFKNADGTVAAPGITFTNETSSGLYRNAGGDVRFSILGTWRFGFNTVGCGVNGFMSIVDATGTKAASLVAPAGLAADYTLTLPTALPGSTLPLLVSSTGVMSEAQLVNAQQNFGTPSAATDVAIKSYVDAGTVTSIDAGYALTAGVSINAGSITKAGNRVYVYLDLNLPAAIAAGNTVMTLGPGFRPNGFGPSVKALCSYGGPLGVYGIALVQIAVTTGVVSFLWVRSASDGLDTDWLPTTLFDSVHINVTFTV